jgi:hypothetical protein
MMIFPLDQCSSLEVASAGGDRFEQSKQQRSIQYFAASGVTVGVCYYFGDSIQFCYGQNTQFNCLSTNCHILMH